MSEKQKVLIVDDEPRNQKIISESLENLVEFKTAATGEEALSLLENYLPDLILLDIMMPGLNGYEVCQRIRKNPKLHLTKVILVSAKAMIEERLKGYEVGADDYLIKPFISEELLAKAKVFFRLTLLEKDLDAQVRDRTKQMLEAEAKLVNAAKMSALGEMAGEIAHEINTPLGTIGMRAEQIQELVTDEPVDLPSISNMSKVIGETVDRIGAIVQGLRTFSRDGSQDHFELVPVKRIVENTLVLCSEKIKNSQVEINIAEIPDDIQINCRSVQISQVIMNLLSNACDAVLPLKERWIKISSRKHSNGQVDICVMDSGSAIPEDVRNKLFQPFFTTKGIGKGTGLGLCISRGIMDAHDGTLGIDPTFKNTCFVMRFPMRETAAEKAN